MITLIFAHDESGGIGFENDLPWPRISEDMKWFRKATSGGALIMGRKTFDSLGKNLPGRPHVVLTRDVSLFWNNPRSCGIDVKSDLESALRYAQDRYGEVFVIGGAEVYKQALPYATLLLVTKVTGSFKSDTFFEVDYTSWDKFSARDYVENGKHVCTFEQYARSQPDIKL